jgi:O-antigen/teichoic acid export membrane protein
MLRRVYESAVVWSYLVTALRVGAGLVILPLILIYLSESDLAFWYVMTAMSQMVLQMDLGFTFSISRSASYLWAGATELKASGLSVISSSETRPNLSLMGNLIATFRLFYFVLAGLLLLVGMALGYIYLLYTPHTHMQGSPYLLIWVLYLLGIGINFGGLLWPAILTGMNRVRACQQLFVVALICNYVVAVGGLWAGWGLWALVAGQLIMGVLIRAGGAWMTKKALRDAGWNGLGHRDTELIKVLWSNSWRTGAVSLGAGMSREAPVYLCGLFFPASVTASLGVTFHMLRLVRHMALVWVQVKIPLIQQKWVTGRLDEPLRIFKQRVWIGTAAYMVGAVAVGAGAPFLLDWLKSDTTMLSGWPFLLVALFFLMDNNRSYFAQLIISMNQIPFWKSWLFSGLLTWPLAYTAGWSGNLPLFLTVWLMLHAVWVFWKTPCDAWLVIAKAKGSA